VINDNNRSTNPFLKSRKIIFSGLLVALIMIVLIVLIVRSVPSLLQSSTNSRPEGSTNSTPGISAASVKDVETSILDNFQQDGFDSNPIINKGLGGLWINWRYGTQPLQVNFNGAGSSVEANIAANSQTRPSHDPFTDLRYLHNLWLYKSQNPSDTRYDSDITKFTSIVKLEFANTHDIRAWLYDEEFMDLYHLSQDNFYKAQALNLVTSYSKAIDPKVGIMYEKNTAHPQGFYRVDLVLESGLDLIQAGTQFANQTWVQQGKRIVDFVFTHAYIPQYHTFASVMDQVLLSDGSINPSELFYIDRFRNYIIQGNSMKMDSISQIIISLLHTYQVTHIQDFLYKAEDLLNPYSLPENSLGMWDTTQLGYFASVNFRGTSPLQPGSKKVATGKKEAGRQIGMLWAFHLVDQFTNNKYQNMESLMLTVALTKAYCASCHGLFYEVYANWTPLNFPDGSQADVVTTEAMGIELESLFSLKY